MKKLPTFWELNIDVVIIEKGWTAEPDRQALIDEIKNPKNVAALFALSLRQSMVLQPGYSLVEAN